MLIVHSSELERMLQRIADCQDIRTYWRDEARFAVKRSRSFEDDNLGGRRTVPMPHEYVRQR